MLILKLVSDSSGKAVFNYFPENKKDYGTLEIDKNTGDINTIKVSESDEFHTYLHKAVSEMTKYFNSGEYKDEITVAWY